MKLIENAFSYPLRSCMFYILSSLITDRECYVRFNCSPSYFHVQRLLIINFRRYSVVGFVIKLIPAQSLILYSRFLLFKRIHSFMLSVISGLHLVRGWTRARRIRPANEEGGCKKINHEI